MYRTFFTACAVIATSFSTAVHAQGIASDSGKIQVVDNRRLNAQQREAFASFSEGAAYFGAFYTSTGGSFGWYRDLNTLQAAEVLADQRCTEFDTGCSLYATIVPDAPAGRRPFDKLAMSLASEAVFWLRSRNGRSGAAIAASGYWGYYSTIRGSGTLRAERDAVRSCQQNLDRDISDWLEPNQIAALEAAGLLECTVIASIKER